jgi:hypothetical protein
MTRRISIVAQLEAFIVSLSLVAFIALTRHVLMQVRDGRQCPHLFKLFNLLIQLRCDSLVGFVKPSVIASVAVVVLPVLHRVVDDITEFRPTAEFRTFDWC